MNSVLSIGVVGSGPSGCYIAQSLRRALPTSEITIYDRLASPFGLVRYGVAPDHQSTKSIQTQFTRLFEREDVRFSGNIDVGSDVTLEQLRNNHHIVVLAAGLSVDRTMGVPGEALPGLYRAGRVTRLFNSHPLEPSGVPEFGKSVAIVGGGNVSIDVLRLLVKQPEDFADSDIDNTALGEYSQNPVRHIDFICRSSVENAPSDPIMLAELGNIQGVKFSCSDVIKVAEDAPRAALARAKALSGLIAVDPGPEPRVEVAMHFGWTPVKIEGDQHVSGIELKSSMGDGAAKRLSADSVVSAIGFDFDSGDWHGLGMLEANPESGFLERGLYRTGWFKRGSRGTIAENRKCAKGVADEILRDLTTMQIQTKPGYTGLPADVRARAVDYSDWQRVESAEIEAASSGRTRSKFPNHAHMVAIAHGARAESATKSNEN